MSGHGLAQIKLNQRTDKNRPVTIYWTNYQETTSENKLTKQLKDFSFGRAWHLDQRNLQVSWRKKQLLVKCFRSNRMNNHFKTAVTHTEIRHPRLPEPSWKIKIVLYICPGKNIWDTMELWIFPVHSSGSKNNSVLSTTTRERQGQLQPLTRSHTPTWGTYLLPKDLMSLL